MSMRFNARDQRTSAKGRKTSLLLEQLEERTLMAFDALDRHFMNLGATPSSTSAIVRSNVGSAPMVDRPVAMVDATSVTGTSATFRVLGRDDGGERNLSYNWQMTSSPFGAQVRFLRNFSNQAKENVLTFDRAGAYTVRVTISDMTGLRTTSDLQFNVVPTLRSFSVISSSGAMISPNASLNTLNTSERFTVRGIDQFGREITSSSMLTWQAVSRPNTSNVSFTNNGNTTTATFDQAGSYQLRVSSGAMSQQFSLNIAQTLRSLSLRSTPDSPLNLNQPITVAGDTYRMQVIGLDQFNRPVASTPSISWSVVSRPASGNASVTMSGSNANLTFTSTGSYALRAQAGSYTANVSFNVTPLVSTIRAVTSNGSTVNSSGISTSAMTASLTARAFDQYGTALATQPTISWEVVSKPSGTNPQLTASGNGVTARFDRAGSYTLRASAGGKTLLVPISVAQTLTSFSLLGPNGLAVNPSSPIPVNGTSARVTLQAMDQFGAPINSTNSINGVTWTTTNSPSNGTATANYSANAATINFTRAGGYTIRATIGNLNQTVSFNVEQSLTSLIALSTTGQTLSTTSTMTVDGTSTRLTAQARDQFNLPMLNQPAFTWSTLSSSSGGTATYATSGSLTTVSFDREGQYSLRIAGGGRTTSLSYNVLSTLTRIAVTPGTATVRANEQQAFAIQCFNQFQRAMNIPTGMTTAWSTTSGTINSVGLFNAGPTAGTATVTARLGNISGSATVQVSAPDTTSPLKDPSISTLVAQLYADAELNRSDVMSILRSAGNDGSVNATELADLRFIVSSTSNYTIPSYVRALATDVVNSNPANMRYQGQAAGNLAAGSSATLLNNLVDKWFLGTDLPAVTDSSITYRDATGTLFATAPALVDAKQGALGDCYFIASVASIAESNPQAIRNMFIDNGDGTYTVRFYGGTLGSYYNNAGLVSSGFRSGSAPADYVTVNLKLPTYSNSTLAYSGSGWNVSSSSTTLWLALAEKAYAQWNETGNAGRDGTNRYAAIEGGWMSDVNAQVLGYNSTSYQFTSSTKAAMINALNAKQAVTLGTYENSGNGLYGAHAYVVTGYNASTDKFTTFNPWGESHPAPLSWAQLTANCSQFIVADPTGSVAIAGSRVSSQLTTVLWVAGEHAEPMADMTSVSTAESVPSHAREDKTELDWNDDSIERESVAHDAIVNSSQPADADDRSQAQFEDSIELIDHVMAELGSLMEMV